ncbi:MAG: C4-type zinc ribbon domain-containing protein [Treponemataceae bacterium]|nr:C4-type zinc ribbon domain-containing protein [Treponemataceae bacterium]
MEMDVVFDKLKELQEVLSGKYSIENQIEESPKKLTAQDELLARMKREYIEKNAVYEEVRSKVAGLKTDLAEAVAARERGEKGMDEITTHREYEALQKEIDDATLKETQVRKDLQKEEKTLFELDENLKAAEQSINTLEEELNASKASLSEEIDALKAEYEELKAKEAEILPGLDSDMVFKFERIIKSKHGKGIVAVKGNVCDGCHMILPAQFANEVHNGEKIVFCPYCSRILFYQEMEEGESEYFSYDDTGSLSDYDEGFGDDDDLDEDGEFGDPEAEDVGNDQDFDD